MADLFRSPSERERARSERELRFGEIKNMQPRPGHPGEYLADIVPPPDYLTPEQLIAFEKVWPGYVKRRERRGDAALHFRRACQREGIGVPAIDDVLAEIDLRRESARAGPGGGQQVLVETGVSESERARLERNERGISARDAMHRRDERKRGEAIEAEQVPAGYVPRPPSVPPFILEPPPGGGHWLGRLHRLQNLGPDERLVSIGGQFYISRPARPSDGDVRVVWDGEQTNLRPDQLAVFEEDNPTDTPEAVSGFRARCELEGIDAPSAEDRAVAREGFTRRSLMCDWTMGMLAGLPMLFGLPLAQVEESECQARGGEECLYTVSWDAELAAAAADPQQRVTALEAQLAAMSERLRSAYATASDLVSTEDLDTVLHRIVERAASAVRAPGFVLAVRPEPGAELQVYSHGIENREAQVLARATREHAAPVSDSTLVVDVTSSRRHYGQLIARYPGAIQFFPQDEEMLSLYAKHAAAVLDMATALQESAHRHDQVSSLLSLSHDLAQAGTSVEIAERLAVAVPKVVDCDRMAVWLWDDPEQCLRALSAWGRTPEQATYIRELTIRPEDTPNLGRMITEREPQFFEKETDDPFVRQLMVRLDMGALALVPIVARDVFLGILSVSVANGPERLRADGELLERLTGVSALAAPAIQNGQLVDTLRHKASHDGLTGLLNRVGFRQHIDGVLDSVRPGHRQVGLLFVDLNDFKQVNDAHGHEAGDELICQAADRLRTIGRGSDEVARLGGDEFAVILADVRRDEQVQAAERRIRVAFAKPFLLGNVPVSISASVGGGVWPDHGRTVKELVRHADAAMYRDKAQGRRPRVSASPVGA